NTNSHPNCNATSYSAAAPHATASPDAVVSLELKRGPSKVASLNNANAPQKRGLQGMVNIRRPFRLDGRGQSPIQSGSDAWRPNHRRGKIGHQYVRRCRHRNCAHRRWPLLLLSRAEREKGDHGFRSEPACADRRRLETPVEG